METIKFSYEKALDKEAVRSVAGEAAAAQKTLHAGDGKGNDFLGWLHLPTSITPAFFDEVEAAAACLRERCEVVVAIGIGGSYLGAKMVIEALSDSFSHLKPAGGTQVLFAGQNIGEDYLYELQELLRGKQFGLINISKSGTTTEPAIAFRLLKKQLEDQVGKAEARKRIVAVTDAARGALRKLADMEGYKTFVIPDDVGGRFSVLTPVGLLPVSTSGSWWPVQPIWRRLVAKTCLRKAISHCNTLRLVTCCIAAERKSKFWSISIPNCISSPNGGNSFMAKAKEKTIRESFRLRSTSRPTFIRWDSGFKTESV